MRIGVPKEIKIHEYRVGLVPSSVRELIHSGNQVFIEKAKLRKAGFRTSQAIVRGDARAALLDRAGEWKPDLIVVGSHGLKGLNRLLMGSVSEAVVRHAACSVQVVRVQRNARPGRPKPRTGRHKAARPRRG
jgi:nucleotide-binding universal stress UspA family protein